MQLAWRLSFRALLFEVCVRLVVGAADGDIVVEDGDDYMEPEDIEDEGRAPSPRPRHEQHGGYSGEPGGAWTSVRPTVQDAGGACSAGPRPEPPQSRPFVANLRPPIVYANEWRAAGESGLMVLREGEDEQSLVAAVCSHAASLGEACGEDGEKALEQAVREATDGLRGLSAGERALQYIRQGWINAASSSDEARLQFVRAHSSFPSSDFLLRELSAFALVATANREVQVVSGTGGEWASVEPLAPDSDIVLMEAWESHALVRFSPPRQLAQQAEGSLLASGASVPSLIPRHVDTDSKDGKIRPPFVFFHRLQHDLEVARSLASRGLIPEGVAETYRLVVEEVVLASGATPSRDALLTLGDDIWDKLYPLHNRRLYVHPSPRVIGSAVSEKPRMSKMRSSSPKPSEAGGGLTDGSVLIADRVLTPMALKRLREFAQLSTVWYEEKPSSLGAYLQTGWATPLLAQISDGLRAAFPDILCDLPLTGAWAFKFDDQLKKGMEAHADAAAVNVNVWITPEKFNMNNSTGGLVVFDATAAGAMGFDEYNGGTTARRTALLEETSYTNVTVPYRENRAVIFDGSRFHQTQAVSFQAGLESRRISATFLYGSRGTYCPLKRALQTLAHRT